MEKTVEIKVSLDAAEMSALISEANQLLEHPTDRTREIVKLFFNGSDTSSELAGINVDRRPADTRDLRLICEPSNLFRKFVAALRAG